MAKKDFIKLSEKHGVNPSMTVCFYCGEATGIALLGKLKGNEEAPKYICNSIEPCDKCKEKYKDYVLILEKPSPEESPTGRWFAVEKEAMAQDYRKFPIVFMSSTDFTLVIEAQQFIKGEQKEE